jgi:hypothetical protein
MLCHCQLTRHKLERMGCDARSVVVAGMYDIICSIISSGKYSGSGSSSEVGE